MLDQSLAARIARASERFSWEWEIAAIAERYILLEQSAATVATFLRWPDPQRIRNLAAKCRDDLYQLAQEECSVPPVTHLPFDPETMTPETDAQNARLLLYCLRQSSGGRAYSAPEPIEGDRDRVNGKLVTFDLCLQAVRAVRLAAELQQIRGNITE